MTPILHVHPPDNVPNLHQKEQRDPKYKTNTRMEILSHQQHTKINFQLQPSNKFSSLSLPESFQANLSPPDSLNNNKTHPSSIESPNHQTNNVPRLLQPPRPRHRPAQPSSLSHSAHRSRRRRTRHGKHHHSRAPKAQWRTDEQKRQHSTI